MSEAMPTMARRPFLSSDMSDAARCASVFLPLPSLIGSHPNGTSATPSFMSGLVRLAPSGLTCQSFQPTLPMRERYSMMPHESTKPHWYCQGVLLHVSSGLVLTHAFSMPGHERPFCETIQPTKAAIETRPCLISAWRYHRSRAPTSMPSLVTVASCSGSHGPMPDSTS